MFVVMQIQISSFCQQQDNKVNDKNEHGRYRHDETKPFKFKVHEIGDDIIRLNQGKGNINKINKRTLFDNPPVYKAQGDHKFQYRQCKEIKKDTPYFTLTHAFMMLIVRMPCYRMMIFHIQLLNII